MLKSALGWGIGSTIGGTGIGIAAIIDGQHQHEAAAQVVFAVLACASVAVAAHLFAANEGVREGMRRQVAAWMTALGVCFAVFMLWEPVGRLLETARPGDINDVRVSVFDPMTSPVTHYSLSSIHVDFSSAQESILVCLPLFGLLGGFMSDAARRQTRRQQSYGRSLIAAIGWGAGMIAGGGVSLVSGYLLAGVAAFLLMPHVLPAVLIACMMASFIGGTTAALVAMPIQRAAGV